jgi:hypothetical protein
MQTSYQALNFLRTDLVAHLTRGQKLTKFTTNYCDMAGYKSYTDAFISIENQILLEDTWSTQWN